MLNERIPLLYKAKCAGKYPWRSVRENLRKSVRGKCPGKVSAGKCLPKSVDREVYAKCVWKRGRPAISRKAV